MDNREKKTIICTLILLTLVMTAILCNMDKVLAGSDEAHYNEKNRPQFHFTPKKNWINDPNGLVYYKGEYHMFYQYNPFGNTWGNMSWGHAVSKDLLHWEHLPIALQPDNLGMIFSGSAVVDEHNTSGFFKGNSGGLVAVYTSAGKTQQQSIAYSADKGRTWTKYANNPVIPNPGIEDFRDPKVFWHGKKWVMVVAAGNKVMFYSSPNLKDWTYMSEFGANEGDHTGIWEVPDLFELPLNGDPKNKKWILKVDVSPGGTAEGYKGQYFIGEFDGTKFTNDNPPDTILRIDYGKDFYAALSWSNVSDRRIWIGWMNNWQYAQEIPTYPWRGAMSIPREVTLRKIPEKGITLIQSPVRELKKLRGDIHTWKMQNIIPGSNLLSNIKGDTLEIEVEFELDSATEFGLKVRKGEHEETTIGFNVTDSQLFVDRTKSGNINFSKHFPGKYTAPLSPIHNRIKLHIFVDRSSVEVFSNDGEIVMTNQIFPSPNSKDVELYSKNGNVKLISMDVYHLVSTSLHQGAAR